MIKRFFDSARAFEPGNMIRIGNKRARFAKVRHIDTSSC